MFIKNVFLWERTSFQMDIYFFEERNNYKRRSYLSCLLNSGGTIRLSKQSFLQVYDPFSGCKRCHFDRPGKYSFDSFSRMVDWSFNYVSLFKRDDWPIFPSLKEVEKKGFRDRISQEEEKRTKSNEIITTLSYPTIKIFTAIHEKIEASVQARLWFSPQRIERYASNIKEKPTFIVYM